jgi:hypothetical protein
MPFWRDREHMPSIEERVSYLEGRVEEHSGAIAGIRDDIDTRLSELDARIARQFTWLVGLQVGTLLAVVGTLLGR